MESRNLVDFRPKGSAAKKKAVKTTTNKRGKPDKPQTNYASSL